MKALLVLASLIGTSVVVVVQVVGANSNFEPEGAVIFGGGNRKGKGIIEGQMPLQTMIGVIGAPLDKGQSKPGVKKGPSFCRRTGFMTIFRDQGLDILDYGDIVFQGGRPVPTPRSSYSGHTTVPTHNVKQVAAGSKLISNQVKKVLKDGRVCLTIGGDHSISIGTIDATSTIVAAAGGGKAAEIGVIWVDAHGDTNTAESSPSGYIYGMPLSFLVKEMQSYSTKFPEFSWVKPRLSAANLVYIGTRALDPPEKTFIKTLNITTFNMEKIRRIGMQKVSQLALAKASGDGKRPIHVSFDIDSMDPTEVRMTGSPVPGGLTFQEGVTLMTEIHNSGRLVALDFAEVNPDEENVAQRRTRAASIIKELIISAFLGSSTKI